MIKYFNRSFAEYKAGFSSQGKYLLLIMEATQSGYTPLEKVVLKQGYGLAKVTPEAVFGPKA